jgi:hypothetical protein
MTTVEISTPSSTHHVLEEKLSSLGLYITAREAYEMWKADPEHVKILDVRTFEEYVLIGHAEMAINVLAKAGFTKLHNIIDGFEGDKVEDPESVYYGQRVRNGWKNSAPWTYKLNHKLVWLPSERELETLLNTLDL